MNAQVRFAVLCPSPVGDWTILSDGDAIVGVYLAAHRTRPTIDRPFAVRESLTRAALIAGCDRKIATQVAILGAARSFAASLARGKNATKAFFPGPLGADNVCRNAACQLEEYFAGGRRVFDVPLAPAGTGFDHRVWKALREIPWGTTWTYGQLARYIGAPTAARAVGAANGRNPISLFIPCHRVIGSNGHYVGYGGGLDAKAWLLAHEESTPAKARPRGGSRPRRRISRPHAPAAN